MKAPDLYKTMLNICCGMTGFKSLIVRGRTTFLSHLSFSSWPGTTTREETVPTEHGRNTSEPAVVKLVAVHRRMSDLRKSMDFNKLKRLLQSSKHFDPSVGSGDDHESETVLSEDERVFLSDEVREQFYEICSSFLGGSWRSLKPNQLKIKHIKGGMTNMLFLCALPDSIKPGRNEHDKTLLRIHFNPETENRLVAESVIFSLLSERKIGPRLYGVFNEGRLEEFIVSCTLKTADIWDQEMSRRIARKLALLHKMSLPISKTPNYLIEALERWFIQLENLRPDLKVCLDKGGNETLTMHDLIKEFQLLKKAIACSKSPVAFCHNDLQEGNILLPHKNVSTSDDIVVIDFEYASYNYRAFDFANHFCEWTFDYTNESSPYFYYFPEKFPDIKQQQNFFGSYLKTIGENCDEKSLAKMIDETSSFVPVSHFFWGVWGLLQQEISPVNFGFTEYGTTRLGIYYSLRSNLMRLLEDNDNNNNST